MKLPWRHTSAQAERGATVIGFAHPYLDDTLALIRRCAALSEAVAPYSPEAFAAAHLGPDARPERDIKLLLDPHGVAGLALFATQGQYRLARRAFLEVLALERRALKQGSVAELLETARRDMMADGLPLDGAFVFLSERTMAREKRLLEGLGFTHERDCLSMTFRPPADYPRPKLEDGFRIEPFWIPGHESEVAERFNQAFRPPTQIPATAANFRPLPGDEWLIPDGALFLYDDGDQLAGCVQVLRHYEGGRAQTFISRLGIVERYRGRGLGRQLLRAAIQAGRRLGFTDARLTVYTDTPDALHMYETEGFRERSRVAQLDWQWRQADGNRGEGSLG